MKASGRRPLKLPPGLKVGDRIRTNARYANAHTRQPGPHLGTILNGCWRQATEVLVKLDCHMHAREMDVRFFEVIVP